MRNFNINVLGLHIAIEASRESPAARRERELTQFQLTNNYYSGDYDSWTSAKDAACGYDVPRILEKVISATTAVRDGLAKYERDSVIFHQPAVAHPLFAWLIYVASASSNTLRVMDFGGALGSAYFQHRHLLAHVQSLKWGVVEQAHYVEAGKKEFETEVLRYFYSLDDCMSAIEPNFGLVSGVLQYLENPYDVLGRLLERNLQYILIDRTTAHRLGRDRLAIQHVPPNIYDASYPVWLLDATRLESLFMHHHYEIVDTFDPHPGTRFGMEGFEAPYMGWFLRKSNG